MQKLVFAALAVVLIVGVSACGGGSSDPAPVVPPVTPPTTQQGLQFTTSNNSSVAVTRLNIGPAGGGGGDQWYDFPDLGPGQSTFIPLSVGNYWLVIEYLSGGNFENDPIGNPGQVGYDVSILTNIVTPVTWP